MKGYVKKALVKRDIAVLAIVMCGISIIFGVGGMLEGNMFYFGSALGITGSAAGLLYVADGIGEEKVKP